MKFKPASLAQLFEPPEQHQGLFGWLCGYAADAGFLEEALERFSGLTQARRAHQGRILLAVLLDSGNPQIKPSDAPGALHLPAKSANPPFALMHAKVCILGFQGISGFVLRLIVSTGNWTRQTLQESLDLAWHLDIGGTDSDAFARSGEDEADDECRQDRADLAAAWDFMSWLKTRYDLRLLERTSSRDDESAEAAAKLASWIGKTALAHQEVVPRFFDNRKRSLCEQLPEFVKHHAAPVARNYLALGSGFFEGESARGEFVPSRILNLLRRERLLTGSCQKNLFVNPFACQGIAANQTSIEGHGWTIRAARAPEYFGAANRTLHAKFIFSANERENSNKCSSAWAYLGSGNLTNPGFMQKAGKAGNLEAGVVFEPRHLKWKAEAKNDDGAHVVTNLLPIHWDDSVGNSLLALGAGEDMPKRDEKFIAAPVARFLWDERPEGTCLAPQAEDLRDYQLCGPDGLPCPPRGDRSFAWPGARPREVTVKWDDAKAGSQKASVPVIDRYGRYCAADLPKLDLEEAWMQLENFPMPPEDEELIGGSAEPIDGALPDGIVLVKPPSDYAVRDMMRLVESIAAKQCAIAESDWRTWCNRLEQVLTQAKDSPVVTFFQSIALDPLHPLLESEFRPEFARIPQSGESLRYEGAIKAITAAWRLENCAKLGSRP